jgi:hypothetical protein
LSVASRYAPLYLSTWFGGKAKVTVRWRVLGWLTTMAMLLALAWLVRLRCAIGCVPVSGLDASATLESGAGVCMHTLGVDAGVGAGTGAYAIGCVPVSGLDTSTTLGSGAGVCMHILGVDAGVGADVGACNTLGVDAGVVIQVFWATGGLVDVVGVLKIAWRLFDCQELGMAIVLHAICLYGDSQGSEAVNYYVCGG